MYRELLPFFPGNWRRWHQTHPMRRMQFVPDAQKWLCWSGNLNRNPKKSESESNCNTTGPPKYGINFHYWLTRIAGEEGSQNKSAIWCTVYAQPQLLRQCYCRILKTHIHINHKKSLNSDTTVNNSYIVHMTDQTTVPLQRTIISKQLPD